jgi:ATP adenylyltransferase
MKQLWAPWRLEYVRSVSEIRDKSQVLHNGCIFCEGIQPGTSTYENLVLGSSREWVVILNKYPYSNGHVLLLPKAHKATLLDLSVSERDTLGVAMMAVEKALKNCYAPHGMNVGTNVGKAAGAGIPEHLHFHFVPRWTGDTNFMPILAEVRCINDHLQSMYERLKPFVQESLRELN